MRFHAPPRRRLAAALLCTLPIGAVQAAVLDFADMPPGLFFGGETVVQGDFTFTVGGDFAVVDTSASCLGGVCPSGNDTQYYQALNDGHVGLARTDGTAFSFSGFDAGFLVVDPLLAVGVPGQIWVTAVLAGGGTASASWDFAAADGQGGFAFGSYADIAGFGNVLSLDFYAVADPAAYGPAQFGLDNVVVGAVPEPETMLLWLGGIAALAAAARRRNA